MSSVLRPIGPQPPATYWRRRLVVFAVVVVVVLIIAVSCAGGGGGGNQAARDDVQPGATSSPAFGSSPSPSLSSSSSAVPSSSPSVATSTSSAGQCANGDLALQTSTDQDSYAAGSQVSFTLVVTNTSATACARDLGHAALNIVVTSGSDRIWASNDCTPGGSPSVTTLAPDKEHTFHAAWNGKRSAPGCPDNQPIATAGTYKVVGMVGSARSAQAVFHLR